MPSKRHCKHCPIVNECNKNKIFIDAPVYETHKMLKQSGTKKMRVCPLVIVAFNCKFVTGLKKT